VESVTKVLRWCEAYLNDATPVSLLGDIFKKFRVSVQVESQTLHNSLEREGMKKFVQKMTTHLSA
jgi:hypothetical protein